jgi:glucokinase
LAIGVDLGGHGIKGVLVDSGGQLLHQDVVPLAPQSRDLAVVEAKIQRLVETMRASHEGGVSAALGLGVPGFLEGEGKVLRSSPNFPGWENISIEARFAGLLGQDVVVENDANCAVLGERWIGGAQGCDNLLLLTLGTGVGTGALVGGRLLSGARGLGAEGGHVALYPGGRRCGCGQRGCLEAYASGPGLAMTAMEAWQEEGRPGQCPATTALEVFAAEAEGGGPNADHWASRAIERYCLDLAQGIAGMVHLLAPEVVLLGGGISGAFARIGPPLQEALKKRCIPAFSDRGLAVRPSALGDFSGAYGAAWVALQEASPATDSEVRESSSQ